MLEKVFKLSDNGTNVRTEVIAGLTTFMTMAYIIALNPNLLTGFGAAGQELWNGVFLATCIASAIGMFCMAFLANKPFAMAPGMGLNSFFAVVVGNIVAMTGMSYVASFQAALIIILVEGIVFIVLSIFNVREKIVEAIPLGIRLGISPAIGLMLMNIGLGSNVGIYAEGNGFAAPFYVMRDFFGALTPSVLKANMGDVGYTTMILTVVTMFVGLFAIIAMAKKGVKGSVLFGMLIASVIYWAGSFVFLGTNPFASLTTASFVPPFADMASTTLFKFNFAGFVEIGWFTVITLVITFCIIDMFDTIGTLVGTASRAGMLDKEGRMPQMKQALVADAVGTLAGSITGTSTVTTFVESASGVEAGGRTGLTSLTTGVLFLLCMFIAPIAALIPAPATSAALIYVGVLMIGGLKNIDWNDISQVVPVALMLIFMPVTGSIGHGIGIALIAYTAIKLCCGKAKEVTVLTYVLAVLFLLKFFLVV
ncbi:NCS2 family permease [bacterium]|nr:NCS2 family permease [bacterium]